jgi:cobalt-zinc-cadmium efflux system membrane fusion protein
MHFIFSAALHAAILLSWVGTGNVLAHEGHDHGDAPPPVTSNVAPRAEATSETYELVAVVGGGEITIYLDRFATNEPVDGASIEVETPLGSETAVARPGDSYRLRAPWVSKPGRYDLIITVTKDGTADVLPVTLEVPSAHFRIKRQSARG